MNKQENDPLKNDINKRILDEQEQLPKKPKKESHSPFMSAIGILMFIIVIASLINVLASLLGNWLH